MSNTSQSKLSALVAALIAAVVAAINTHRTDTAAIAKQKADSDEQIQLLQDKIKELEGEEADVEGLRPQIEEALTAAQAAKPPTDEHIAEVDKIEPAPDAGDAADSGGAKPTGNTQTTQSNG